MEEVRFCRSIDMPRESAENGSRAAWGTNSLGRRVTKVKPVWGRVYSSTRYRKNDKRADRGSGCQLWSRFRRVSARSGAARSSDHRV